MQAIAQVYGLQVGVDRAAAREERAGGDHRLGAAHLRSHHPAHGGGSGAARVGVARGRVDPDCAVPSTNCSPMPSRTARRSTTHRPCTRRWCAAMRPSRSRWPTAGSRRRASAWRAFRRCVGPGPRACTVAAAQRRAHGGAAGRRSRRHHLTGLARCHTARTGMNRAAACKTAEWPRGVAGGFQTQSKPSQRGAQ